MCRGARGSKTCVSGYHECKREVGEVQTSKDLHNCILASAEAVAPGCDSTYSTIQQMLASGRGG